MSSELLEIADFVRAAASRAAAAPETGLAKAAVASP
jgi:hypothetical protein